MISNTATRKRIGKNILHLINKKNISYRQLDTITSCLDANKKGIDYADLNKIANGLKNITWETLERISDALEVDILELVQP